LPTASETRLRSLPRLTVTEGELIVLNTNDTPILSISGIKLEGQGNASRGWNGFLEARQATLDDRFIFHQLHSLITFSPTPSTLSLENFMAVLGGGTLQGTCSLDLTTPAPRYSTTLNLSGASLHQFLADASLNIPSSEGKVAGTLQLAGIAGLGVSMEGKGDLCLSDVVIQPVDFLRQIGQLLQIEELQLLRLADGKLLFHLHEGHMQINNLSLRSENLILAAEGPFQSNGDLDLKARLLFNEKLTARLRGILGSQLSPAPEAGYSQIAFHVSGPLKNPKTDLLERLTGIHLGGDLGGFLQGLFGSPTPRPPASQNTPPALGNSPH
jgi:hypothetical protein